MIQGDTIYGICSYGQLRALDAAHAAERGVGEASAAAAALADAYPGYALDAARATVEAIYSELDGSAGR